MEKGIVYNLINPCLDGWVKIGMSSRNNINERLAELNRPENLPFPNGKIREREFFRISPEKAFDVLKSVSLLRGVSEYG